MAKSAGDPADASTETDGITEDLTKWNGAAA